MPQIQQICASSSAAAERSPNALNLNQDSQAESLIKR